MEMLSELLGMRMEPNDLSVIQVCARAAVIFLYCILLVRIGDKRFLSRKSALDAVLGFILASMMARAVNGSAPFVPTLAGGAILVLLHRFLAAIAMRSHAFGCLLKGNSELAIENGQVNERTLRKNNFSEADMLEDLRLEGVNSPAKVKRAFIERNGQLSVIKS